MLRKQLKILAVTGIRSDYDLLSSLYKSLNRDLSVDLRLLVGGAHLSATFGRSIDQIREDQLKVLAEIESLTDTSSDSARLSNFANFLSGSIGPVVAFAPDIILYAGDREDAMLGAMLGGYLDIPTLHFYGGDQLKNGHIDNDIRHAVSKLSTAHFVALEEHKTRLMSIGEEESRIFVTGNISLDNFTGFKPKTISAIQSELGFPAKLDGFVLVIFHPTYLDELAPEKIFENILESLLLRKQRAFVSYPNIDPGNEGIRKLIDYYSGQESFYFYRNLPRETFLSIYKRSQFIIGNSSSGICEAASIPIPAIDVGKRQLGRYSAQNVIAAEHNQRSILAAIDTALSDEFLVKVSMVKNPYGLGFSTKLAHQTIVSHDFSSMRLKTLDPINLVTNGKT